MSIDNSRDGIIVDVASLSSDELYSSDALLLSLVSEHRSRYYITDCVDIREVGLEMFVDDNSVLVVKFNSHFLGAESVGEGSSSSGDENIVGIKSLFFPILDSLNGDFS